MDSTQNSSRLRYLDADKLDDGDVDFDGMDVYGWEHDKLGDLDGFIVDNSTGRLYYAVIDSGGWFSSRQFLLPMGHLLRFDADKRELHTDLAKDGLRELPRFDRDTFARFTDDELRAFEQKTSQACCPDVDAAAKSAWTYDTAPHYQEPEWWRERRKVRRTADAAGVSRDRAPVQSSRVETDAGGVRREHVTARADEERSVGGGDVSPHPGGRAQPGDVVGVETGGERTYLGDTTEDENERRRTAEKRRE
jgi:hypothetical protein